MRVLPLASILFAFLVLGTASAADSLIIQIFTVDEQPGRIAATISVSTPEGKPIAGLGTANFKATLGETPLNVSDLLGSSAARQPASVVLLVDVSGSMGGEPITQAKAAMQDFVRTLDPGDRVSIITFGTRVTLWQDFTSDRNVLYQSISRITTAGETALYDGVLQGLQKIGEAPPGRRMLVMLSDGAADAGRGRRAESLEAAASTGVNITAVAFGGKADTAYLKELAAASGGRVLQTNTSSGLRQAYADIAAAIRSQYTVVLAVPSGVDRTGPAKLSLQVTLRADTGTGEWQLGPLAGATVPPFDLKIAGVAPGQKVTQGGAITLVPKPAPGTVVVYVDYLLDDQPVHSANAEPFGYQLDSKSLALGNHLLTVRAWEAGGRPGEAQVAFTMVTPSGSSVFGGKLVVFVLLFAAVGAVAYFVLGKKKGRLQSVAGRVSSFARRAEEPLSMSTDVWPAPVKAPPPLQQLPPPSDRILGRVVVLDEAAVRGGNLDAIREYEIKSQPLTVGSSAGCDIQLEDDQGRIPAEEARVWVQKGRLVYHRLSTLSAMATEGMTSGWEFLESGEEMQLGPYRILFEELAAEQPQQSDEPEPEIAAAEPLKPVQEHGMTLTDLWSRVRDDSHLTQPSE